MAINYCSERAYRGCTMAYCNKHSGQENRRRKQCCMCKLCASDKHVDICSECSNDILSAQKKFYCMSALLSMLVFCVLLCLLHVSLQAVPGLCPSTSSPDPPSSHFCTVFHRVWHEFSIYNRESTPHALVPQENEASFEEFDFASAGEDALDAAAVL